MTPENGVPLVVQSCILCHKRVKILTDEGFEYGDIEIPIYKPGDQSVSSIKATIYVLNENGSIEANRLMLWLLKKV